MKIPRFSNAVGNLDDDLIEAAAECKRKKKPNLWLKWGSIAACFAMLIVAGAMILPSLLNDSTSPGGTNDRYKEHFIQAGESNVVWPWKYLTVYEKYTSLKLDGIEYRSHGRPVSENLLGDLIGTYSVVGYDNIDGGKYTEDFEVYQLKHADKSELVAVKMEGTCYVFKKDKYEPPRTLGELFELVELPKAIELNRFSVNGDSSNKKHYTLSNDDYVWEVLAGCENASFVEDEKWVAHDREYYSFTITSETLGVYKVAMYVTVDGYLWTNAFNYQYLFNIGEDAAGKIIKYAKENSTEAEYEPYQNTIVGKITEITDAYILLDDSILCANPDDGITYKILLNDLRISRYAESGAIRVGENVQITYEGEIDESNTIDSAISAVVISGGDVLIPE